MQQYRGGERGARATAAATAAMILTMPHGSGGARVALVALAAAALACGWLLAMAAAQECIDIPPDDNSCSDQREWGKCEADWMINGGYCAATCGFCEELASELPGEPKSTDTKRNEERDISNGGSQPNPQPRKEISLSEIIADNGQTRTRTNENNAEKVADVSRGGIDETKETEDSPIVQTLPSRPPENPPTITPLPLPAPSPPPPPSVVFDECPDIQKVVAGVPELSTMAEIIDFLVSNGTDEVVEEMLNDDDSAVTLFIPTNEAFSNHLKALKLDDEPTEENLNKILRVHAIDGIYASGTMKPKQTFETFEKGHTITVLTRKNGQRVIEGAKTKATIIFSDIRACRSFIHVIDNVLVPQKF